MDVLDLNYIIVALDDIFTHDSEVDPTAASHTVQNHLEELCTYLSVGGDSLNISIVESHAFAVVGKSLRVQYSDIGSEIVVFAMRAVALLLERKPVAASRCMLTSTPMLFDDMVRILECGTLCEALLGDELLRILNILSQAAPLELVTLDRGYRVMNILLQTVMVGPRGGSGGNHTGGAVNVNNAISRSCLVIFTRLTEHITPTNNHEWSSFQDQVATFFNVFHSVVDTLRDQSGNGGGGGGGGNGGHSPVTPNARTTASICITCWSTILWSFQRVPSAFTHMLQRYGSLFHKIVCLEDPSLTRLALLAFGTAGQARIQPTITMFFSESNLESLQQHVVAHPHAHKEFVGLCMFLTQYLRPNKGRGGDSYSAQFLWGHGDQDVLDYTYALATADFDASSNKVEFEETMSHLLENGYRDHLKHEENDEVSSASEMSHINYKTKTIGTRGSDTVKNLYRCPIPCGFVKQKEGPCVCMLDMDGNDSTRDAEVGADVEVVGGCCGTFFSKFTRRSPMKQQQSPQQQQRSSRSESTLLGNSSANSPPAAATAKLDNYEGALALLLEMINTSFVNSVIRDTLRCLDNVLMYAMRGSNPPGPPLSYNRILLPLDALLSTALSPLAICKAGGVLITVEGEIVANTLDCLRQIGPEASHNPFWGQVLGHMRSVYSTLLRDCAPLPQMPPMKSMCCPIHVSPTDYISVMLHRLHHLVQLGAHRPEKAGTAKKQHSSSSLSRKGSGRLGGAPAAEDSDEEEPRWTPLGPHCSETHCGVLQEMERRVAGSSTLPLEHVSFLKNHLLTSSCHFLRGQSYPVLEHWLLWMTVQHIPRISDAPVIRSIMTLPGNVYWMSLRNYPSLFEHLHVPLTIQLVPKGAQHGPTRTVEVFPFVSIKTIVRHITRTMHRVVGSLHQEGDIVINMANELDAMERLRHEHNRADFMLSIDNVLLRDPNMTIFDAFLHHSHNAESLRSLVATTWTARRALVTKLITAMSSEAIVFHLVDLQGSADASVEIGEVETRSVTSEASSAGILFVPPIGNTAKDVMQCLVMVQELTQGGGDENSNNSLTRHNSSVVQTSSIIPADARSLWNKLNMYTLQEILQSAALFVYPSLQIVLGGAGLVCLNYLSHFPQLFSLQARVQLFYQVLVRSPHDMLASFPAVAQGMLFHRQHYAGMPPLGGEFLSASTVRPTRRVKAVVERNNIVDQAMALLHHYGSLPMRIEIEYSGEVGTGEGPIKEFYQLVASKLVSENMSSMWCDSVGKTGLLYPKPRTIELITAEAFNHYRLFGNILGKALQEKITLDIPLHEEVIRLIYDAHGCAYNKSEYMTHHGNRTQTLFASIDPDLSKVLEDLEQVKEDAVWKELMMPFTLPGNDDVELCELGSERYVNASNVTEFSRAVREFYLSHGVKLIVETIGHGINDIIPLLHVSRFFTPREFLNVVAGDRAHSKLWQTPEEFLAVVLCDHGFTASSPAVQFLARTVAAFTPEQQRDFLQFVSGVRSLHPVYGLQPPLTVVVRECDGTPDQYLPSVNTCFHYLKLPQYSSEEALTAKLVMAIEEGQQTFQLS
eukprot:PhF_6_TR40240/c0_g1_i1/m.59852/K10590/TRIP12; E3 ubiquitin-protein ligase TRIP12